MLEKKQLERIRALAECEATIKKGIDHWRAVGLALDRIDKEALYKPEFKTFGAYCRVKWDIHRNHAYRKMNAAVVAQAIDPRSQFFHSERAVRDFTKRQISPAGSPTAAALRQRLDKMTSTEQQDLRQTVQERFAPPPKIPAGPTAEEVRAKLDSMSVEDTLKFRAKAEAQLLDPNRELERVHGERKQKADVLMTKLRELHYRCEEADEAEAALDRYEEIWLRSTPKKPKSPTPSRAA